MGRGEGVEEEGSWDEGGCLFIYLFVFTDTFVNKSYRLDFSTKPHTRSSFDPDSLATNWATLMLFYCYSTVWYVYVWLTPAPFLPFLENLKFQDDITTENILVYFGYSSEKKNLQVWQDCSFVYFASGRVNIFQDVFSTLVHLYSIGNISTSLNIFQKKYSCRALMKSSTNLKFTYS